MEQRIGIRRGDCVFVASEDDPPATPASVPHVGYEAFEKAAKALHDADIDMQHIGDVWDVLLNEFDWRCFYVSRSSAYIQQHDHVFVCAKALGDREKKTNVHPESLECLGFVENRDFFFEKSVLHRYAQDRVKAYRRMLQVKQSSPGLAVAHVRPTSRGAKGAKKVAVKKTACKVGKVGEKAVSKAGGKAGTDKSSAPAASSSSKRKMEEHVPAPGRFMTDKPVVALGKDTGVALRYYVSVKEASELLGALTCNIRNVCQGRRKSCKGFGWRFAHPEEVEQGRVKVASSSPFPFPFPSSSSSSVASSSSSAVSAATPASSSSTRDQGNRRVERSSANPDHAEVCVRGSTTNDVPQIAAIYAHYIDPEDVTTFEEEVPTDAEMSSRRQHTLEQGFPYLVAVETIKEGPETKDVVVGYAYAGKYKERACYRFSCEDSIYLHPDHCGKGIGSALLQRLLQRLKQNGMKQVVAVLGTFEVSTTTDAVCTLFSLPSVLSNALTPSFTGQSRLQFSAPEVRVRFCGQV